MSVYNTPEEWLRQAIQSILSQTYTNFEFIIILDCPTDDSAEIISEYEKSDSRIKVVKNNCNMGLTYNLNCAVKIAKGEYIARMDSDDISLPDRFKKQLIFMESHKNIAVVGSYVCGFNDKQNDIPIMNNCTNRTEYDRIRMLVCNAGVVHSTAFIRRSFLSAHNINYDLLYKKSQDYGLWSDITMQGGVIKCIEEVLVLYRISNNQITHKFSDQQIDAVKRIMGKQLRLLVDLDEISNEDILINYLLAHYSSEVSCNDIIKYADKIIRYNNSKGLYNKRMFVGEIKSLVLAFVLKQCLRDKKLVIPFKAIKFFTPVAFYYLITKRSNDKKYQKAIINYYSRNRINNELS